MRLKRGQRTLFIPEHAGKEVRVERRTIAFSETSSGFRPPVGRRRDFISGGCATLPIGTAAVARRWANRVRRRWEPEAVGEAVGEGRGEPLEGRRSGEGI